MTAALGVMSECSRVGHTIALYTMSHDRSTERTGFERCLYLISANAGIRLPPSASSIDQSGYTPMAAGIGDPGDSPSVTGINWRMRDHAGPVPPPDSYSSRATTPLFNCKIHRA
jgi:hypothetical protein